MIIGNIIIGILALFHPDIRDLIDIKIYVETADDIRIIRRITRDIEKRDRAFSSVIEQYYQTVRPMHIQFVEPTKKYADIIIEKFKSSDLGYLELINKIEKIIGV